MFIHRRDDIPIRHQHHNMPCTWRNFVTTWHASKSSNPIFTKNAEPRDCHPYRIWANGIEYDFAKKKQKAIKSSRTYTVSSIFHTKQSCSTLLETSPFEHDCFSFTPHRAFRQNLEAPCRVEHTCAAIRLTKFVLKKTRYSSWYVVVLLCYKYVIIYNMSYTYHLWIYVMYACTCILLHNCIYYMYIQYTHGIWATLWIFVSRRMCI